MEFKVENAEDVDGQKEKIIKWKDITTLIDENIETFKKCYIKETTDLLNQEMTNGGLSPYALCIEGQTPIFDETQKLNVKANELTADMSALDTEIQTCYHKQRAKELRKLSTAIQTAIDTHNNKLEDYKKKSTALKGTWAKIEALKSSCKEQGIKYQVDAFNLSNSYSSYQQMNSLSGEVTVIIKAPALKADAYEDDIDREKKEVEKLTAAKNTIDTEASKEEGEV